MHQLLSPHFSLFDCEKQFKHLEFIQERKNEIKKKKSKDRRKVVNDGKKYVCLE